MQAKLSSWIQTDKTRGQSYSDTSPGCKKVFSTGFDPPVTPKRFSVKSYVHGICILGDGKNRTCQEIAHLLCSTNLLFGCFGFSCFAYVKSTTYVLVWLNPTSETEGQLYSDTFPYEVREYSLALEHCETVRVTRAWVAIKDPRKQNTFKFGSFKCKKTISKWMQEK